MAILLAAGLIASGCATRQVSDNLSGSTGQRLVSYSIEKWIAELPSEPFETLRGQPVHIKTRFIEESPALSYATDLLTMKLQERFNVMPAVTADDASYEVVFFFNSLGTDADYVGLSLPFIDTSGGGNSSRIDLLALDMYHGVSEGHFVVRNVESGEITHFDKRLARIRTDSLSTPILKIPVSNLK